VEMAHRCLSRPAGATAGIVESPMPSMPRRRCPAVHRRGVATHHDRQRDIVRAAVELPPLDAPPLPVDAPAPLLLGVAPPFTGAGVGSSTKPGHRSSSSLVHWSKSMQPSSTSTSRAWRDLARVARAFEGRPPNRPARLAVAERLAVADTCAAADAAQLLLAVGRTWRGSRDDPPIVGSFALSLPHPWRRARSSRTEGPLRGIARLAASAVERCVLPTVVALACCTPACTAASPVRSKRLAAGGQVWQPQEAEASCAEHWFEFPSWPPGCMPAAAGPIGRAARAESRTGAYGLCVCAPTLILVSGEAALVHAGRSRERCTARVSRTQSGPAPPAPLIHQPGRPCRATRTEPPARSRPHEAEAARRCRRCRQRHGAAAAGHCRLLGCSTAAVTLLRPLHLRRCTARAAIGIRSEARAELGELVRALVESAQLSLEHASSCSSHCRAAGLEACPPTQAACSGRCRSLAVANGLRELRMAAQAPSCRMDARSKEAGHNIGVGRFRLVIPHAGKEGEENQRSAGHVVFLFI